MTERPLTVKGARQLISLTASLPAKVIVPLYAIDRGARSISIAKLMQLGLLRALIETNPDAPDDMTVVELAWPVGAELLPPLGQLLGPCHLGPQRLQLAVHQSALDQRVTELRAWQLKACALLGIAYPEDIDTLTPKPEPEYPASDLTCEHCGLDEVASNHECEARP